MATLTEAQRDYLLKVLHDVDTRSTFHDGAMHAEVTSLLSWPDLPKQRVDLLVIPFDLLRIAQGNEMNLGSLVGHPGTEVYVRLFTAEEFMAVQHESCENMGHPEFKIDLLGATQRTRPLPSS